MAMTGRSDSWIRRPLGRFASALLLAGLVAVLAPGASPAAITTFGSRLSVAASLNTTENLGYLGTYTPVPPSPEAPDGRYHTNHWGADDALWNAVVAGGSAAAPATGQAVKVSLEGCAQPAANGPPPLRQFHFQSISPIPGGFHVNLTSQPYDIPVCGQGGASGSTVTTYEPVNLCVAQGDYVAFNDEGGYVPFVYRSGVPYQVIGSSAGSALDSFIRGNGTKNGATLSSSDTTANDGFTQSANEELMLQVTLGTGPDATHICAGGTAGSAPVLSPLHVRAQTDGVNHGGMVAVSIYCRPASGCRGVATLTLAGGHTTVGHASFNLAGNKTGRMQLRLSSKLLALIRKHHGITAIVTASMGATTVSQLITIKIL
jgi:hypothetical protein